MGIHQFFAKYRQAGAAALVLAASTAAHAGPDRSLDFLVYVDGVHAGDAHWTWQADGTYRETLRIETAQPGGRRSASIETLELARDGDGWTWWRRVDAGAVDRRTAGRIDGATLTRDGDVIGRWPGAVVLPPDRLARIASLDAGRFGLLDLERERVYEAALAACPVATDEPDATRCVRLRTAAGEERWHLAVDGRPLRIERSLAGLPLTLRACTEDCGRAVAKPFDIVGRLVVASPVRIPRRLAQATLRYVITRADGAPPLLAATGEQAVARDGARAIVTVCRGCGAPSAETPASLAPYLAANDWVRSDDARIRTIAVRSGRGRDTVAERMNALAAQVRRRMGKGVDFLGYADAVQALRTGRGDCTEYAVLLAALARAQGLPARVAVGMVYSSRFTGHKHAFSPHAWVQVWDGGRWTSYDAAFDGFDATHVALATGTGDPADVFEAFAQLRQLRIERVGEVAR